jgi:hypothetical protein
MNPVTVGPDFTCRCGARVYYRFVGAHVGTLANAAGPRYAAHHCPLHEPAPIDWRECRDCDAAVFELAGATFDDPLGREPHRCAPVAEATPVVIAPVVTPVVTPPRVPWQPASPPRGRASRQQHSAIQALRAQLGIAGTADIPSTLSAQLAAAMIGHLQEQLQSDTTITKVMDHG